VVHVAHDRGVDMDDDDEDDSSDEAE
jgi:hypothetical protein